MSQIPPEVPTGIPLQYATPQPMGPNVRGVGLAQRRIMWVILAAIVLGLSFFGGASLMPADRGAQWVVLALLTLLRLAILALMMVSIYQLSKALGNGTGACILFVIAMIIPCVSLIVLLVLNQKATNYLKQNNVKVGLMGARLSDLPPA